jgi:hypothetical protein
LDQLVLVEKSLTFSITAVIPVLIKIASAALFLHAFLVSKDIMQALGKYVLHAQASARPATPLAAVNA